MYRADGDYNRRDISSDEQYRRPLPTLYASREDLKDAIVSAVDALNSSDLPKDDQGYSSIEALCEKLKKALPHLSYITRNHIVELFFKDRTRKIMITGVDSIKYKEVRYVQPPETLYFGTLESLTAKMRRFGIHSNTKGYIKLYETPELAADFAKKFATDPMDRITVLSIAAFDAFTSGLKFSTFKPSEFIVVRIDQKFIKGVAQ
jgi:RNA:NAD 2'-phosphotransferase (TPT1/KptA family)